jgi:hypothetical protein
LLLSDGMHPRTIAAVSLALLAPLVGCVDDSEVSPPEPITCEAGTHEEDGLCVPDVADGTYLLRFLPLADPDRVTDELQGEARKTTLVVEGGDITQVTVGGLRCGVFEAHKLEITLNDAEEFIINCEIAVDNPRTVVHHLQLHGQFAAGEASGTFTYEYCGCATRGASSGEFISE